MSGGLVGVEQAINTALVNQVVRFVDTFWADKPYARFYALETVARVPYFGATHRGRGCLSKTRFRERRGTRLRR